MVISNLMTIFGVIKPPKISSHFYHVQAVTVVIDKLQNVPHTILVYMVGKGLYVDHVPPDIDRISFVTAVFRKVVNAITFCSVFVSLLTVLY